MCLKSLLIAVPTSMDYYLFNLPQKVRCSHLALLRRIALNGLNREQSFKRSNRQKSNRAAMDNNYMLTILAACLSQHDNASKSIC